MSAKKFFERNDQWGKSILIDQVHFDKEEMIDFAEAYHQYKIASDGDLSLVSNFTVVWKTLDSMDGERTLKQHAFIPDKRGAFYEDKYDGNKALCSKSGIHDGDKFVNIENELSEDIDEVSYCKKCLKIYKAKYSC